MTWGIPADARDATGDSMATRDWSSEDEAESRDMSHMRTTIKRVDEIGYISTLTIGNRTTVTIYSQLDLTIITNRYSVGELF